MLCKTRFCQSEKGVASGALARSCADIRVWKHQPELQPQLVAHAAAQDMFSRSGEVLRLVLPPTHVLALIEYQEPAAARAAFAALAYKRLRGAPMYLEWAPANIWAASFKVGSPC